MRGRRSADRSFDHPSQACSRQDNGEISLGNASYTGVLNAFEAVSNSRWSVVTYKSFQLFCFVSDNTPIPSTSGVNDNLRTIVESRAGSHRITVGRDLASDLVLGTFM